MSMHEDDEELGEIVVQTMRGTRTIERVPTRIEFISGEELDGKSSMKPGDIRMLLSGSTGIATQQTSAISDNAAIRIQGLDGRYTQILKDGFPAFAGAVSGLGLLQPPLLDLKQVEIVKCSSSTLYGGGAIAGLVNFISKTPGERRELDILLNGSSAKGLDKDVLPIDAGSNKLKRSYGGNWDINYVTDMFGGEVTLAVNQLFFYTYIAHPLLMKQVGNGMFRMENINGHIDTKGCETNVKLGYKGFHLLLGYTFTDAGTSGDGAHHDNYLTPRHRLNAILMCEVEDEWRVGLESYYYGKQTLSDGREGKPYTMFGLIVEKI